MALEILLIIVSLCLMFNERKPVPTLEIVETEEEALLRIFGPARIPEPEGETEEDVSSEVRQESVAVNSKIDPEDFDPDFDHNSESGFESEDDFEGSDFESDWEEYISDIIPYRMGHLFLTFAHLYYYTCVIWPLMIILETLFFILTCVLSLFWIAFIGVAALIKFKYRVQIFDIPTSTQALYEMNNRLNID